MFFSVFPTTCCGHFSFSEEEEDLVSHRPSTLLQQDSINSGINSGIIVVVVSIVVLMGERQKYREKGESSADMLIRLPVIFCRLRGRWIPPVPNYCFCRLRSTTMNRRAECNDF